MQNCIVTYFEIYEIDPSNKSSFAPSKLELSDQIIKLVHFDMIFLSQIFTCGAKFHISQTFVNILLPKSVF